LSVPSHQCGHHGVYHAECQSCRTVDLASSPDVHVRAFLKRYREQHGRDAMKALAAQVQATRQEAKP